MTVKKEILKEFLEKFGANKIWVKPSRENVETILDIHILLESAIDQSYKQGAKDMAESVSKAEKRKTFKTHGEPVYDSENVGFNQAIDEMESRANKFLEKL